MTYRVYFRISLNVGRGGGANAKYKNKRGVGGKYKLHTSDLLKILVCCCS